MDEQLIAIVGAGVMGTGISTLVVGAGLPVVLVDVDQGVLERATTAIANGLRHAQLTGALPPGRTPGELRTTLSLSDVAAADVVIEAVTELPDQKAQVLSAVSALVRPATPLISNTSGIPIDEMAAWVKNPDDLIGTHFMNPAYLISMVEVIRGPQTADRTVESVLSLLTRIGRRAVVVHDAPGFVTSRLLHPMINDAAQVVRAGTATVEDVDTLMQGCLGHPTGPLRTADLIGIDNLVDALEALYARTGDERCRPSELLLEKVRRGELGRKSGRGFYNYSEAQS
ncbi:3-hydroxyacyl-CoA dehydrogenase family protein [Kitasatospora aureofaciens]|uniref:3-hydroxyacyl-CoA dehydrogenase n=1 Tax=Kitasatospora aureofaciens TaxID=1894 RepID=A0A1E7N995_KITAU|nr:3-hydroxyacyl-CoA dehydrogenase family protein [Kitasatospora aureofaciens]OEV37270.1 3-hydroxyacyl-CoA dehydrogenase [Kitasatospora aureofaciens]UKZ03115.1 3-hydroxyacyl-CoA dehydrogenase family protein [Streptomyces viridifaciens]GGU95720.1 3-hydroxybutyryl-CoA dehydrogenase [Kitasatospora aureofaciens]